MAFTEDQIDDLTNTLDPGVVGDRKQGGTQVQYIEAWHAIAEANRIFGHGNWNRETIEMRMVQEKETTIGKGKQYEKEGFKVSYIAKVRVTVHAGGDVVIKEGTGAGHGIDADVGQAHESATKEAESDAMKRAMMMFGNPFGLALYDKSRASVATPRESKANSRGLYEALQAALRAQTSSEALSAWGRANGNDIRSLPSDWEESIRDEFAAELRGHKEAEAGNTVMDEEFRKVVA